MDALTFYSLFTKHYYSTMTAPFSESAYAYLGSNSFRSCAALSINELTSDIPCTFLQRVAVKKHPKKYSRNAMREVSIYYRDIGLLDDMPEADNGEPEGTECP